MREVGRGRQPSVRSVRPWDSAGCQSRDSTEKMEYTLSPDSRRSALTGLALNYSVSAPLLCSSLLFSPLFLQLAAVCLCVLCKKRAEKKNRKESGGRVASTYNRLPGDSIEDKAFPEAFIYLCLLFEYISSPTPRICFLSPSIGIDCMFY